MKIALKEWSEALVGLTPEQLTIALQHCKTTCEFPPSIAQFRKAALGIMPAEQAWLCRYTDTLASAAYEQCDSYLMKQLSEKEARARFIDAYELLADDLCRGNRNE